MTTNTQILLAETPRGKLESSHFQIQKGRVPTPEDGQVLVRSVLLLLDAANRAWMQGATYKSAVEAGQIMHGYAIGEVVAHVAPQSSRVRHRIRQLRSAHRACGHLRTLCREVSKKSKKYARPSNMEFIFAHALHIVVVQH